jgi:hypothetical protein
VSLWGPPYAFGVSGIPYGEMRDNIKYNPLTKTIQNNGWKTNPYITITIKV